MPPALDARTDREASGLPGAGDAITRIVLAANRYGAEVSGDRRRGQPAAEEARPDERRRAVAAIVAALLTHVRAAALIPALVLAVAFQCWFARSLAPVRRQARFLAATLATCAVGLAGFALAGPCVFELPETTFLVPAGWRTEVDAAGTIVAAREPGPT